MARSHGVVKVSVWEPGSEFRSLTVAAQRAYMMLLSQPQINNCGVLPYTPERWVRYASGDTKRALNGALRELSVHNFVVVDERTAELLVRTFIKHDKIEEQPNLRKSAIRLYREVESPRIREVLLSQYAWLSEADPEPPTEGVPEGLSEGVPEGVEEPPTEGGNARTPAAPGPSPAPRSLKKQAVATGRPANGNHELPADIEHELNRLMALIGTHADTGTPTILTNLAKDLPLNILALTRESLTRSEAKQPVKNRAAYVVAALKAEVNARNRKPTRADQDAA